MTNRIDEIAARLAARTQGEWEFDDTEEGGCHGDCYWGLLTDGKPLDVHVMFCKRPLFSNYGPDYANQERIARANATFIANAPADITFLLAEVERLREALKPFAEANCPYDETARPNWYAITKAAHDALEGKS